jgi:hypothetical protein
LARGAFCCGRGGNGATANRDNSLDGDQVARVKAQAWGRETRQIDGFGGARTATLRLASPLLDRAPTLLGRARRG